MGLNSYIAKQFSRPTGVGGRAVSYIMNRQNRPLYDETIRLLQLSDHQSVLDIGCGNGFVMNILAKRYYCRLTGMVISESIISRSLSKNERCIGEDRRRLLRFFDNNKTVDALPLHARRYCVHLF